MTNWLKENLWNLIVTLALICVAYGSLTVQNAWRDEKIKDTQADIVELKKASETANLNFKACEYQIKSSETKIAHLESKSDGQQNTISEIKAQLGILNTKLDSQEKKMDNILEMLRVITKNGK